MRRVLAALGAALLLGQSACTEGPAPAPAELRIATGGPGGVYYEYGQGIAEAVRTHLPGLEPEVLATAASLDNVRMILGGEAEVAFSLADSVALAVAGEPPFEEPQPVRTLARLYDNYVHLVVASDSDINSLADLRGHPVSTGAEGSGTELIVDRLLELAGIDPGTDLARQRLNIDGSASALASGELSAFFFSSGLPAGAIHALADAGRIRLIDLSREVTPMRERYGELYTERSIPQSVYGLPATGTIGVPNYLVVGADLDDDLARALTGLLFTARDELAEAHPEARRLNLRAAYSTYPAELHPGAVQYYRETRTG
ncbi:TAXI family TRAP transporter solute-binding subunit [Streptomyces sp. ACA25]|uniref:TAXI family TRAP transporter solute-binding subunit n=1 Tax=Streptomyces sp. ACA25 TaxID=3022596 RepID=UPI002306E853|nr:TAXI family TRAP transporter solute-binding subunit [Streptomyces sp. ACA25]MDB1088979.1 TAXI family TRAP transporter solute-binding subunit [Streptomyces sp. ACA25]